MDIHEKNKIRIQQIKEQLQALQPTFIEVVDDSHKHIGHAGAKSGAGHFTLHIGSEQLAGLNRIQQHQKIYGLLDNMMGPDIHALVIKVKPA